MGNSKVKEIERLLRVGLDHYGYDEVGEAILAWRGVLALDPGNAEAADYMKTADRRKHPRPEKTGKVEAAQESATLEARKLIASGQLDGALDLLRSAAGASQLSLELEATVELLRSALLREYRELVGDGSAVPEIATDPAQITKFNLPSDAGFLLSLVDGATTMESLITVSGMDSFEALRTTKSLIDAGIVRMQS
jgi:hypothetical protein